MICDCSLHINLFQEPQLVEASTGTDRPDLINKIGKRIRFIIIIIVIIIITIIIISVIAIIIRFRRKKKEKIKTENRAKKALKTISLILGAFVTCWTPYHILAIVRLTHIILIFITIFLPYLIIGNLREAIL